MLAISKAISKSIGKPVARGNRVGTLTPQPDLTNLLAWYKTTVSDGKLIAFKPEANHTTQQVKSSGFSGAAGDYPVTGLLTTDVITFSGPTGPSCTVNGTLSFPADPNCWDIWVHRDGEVWAYWPGINVGQATELDASGNGHHLTGLVGTTITERVDGSGTNWANETGYSDRENLCPRSNPSPTTGWNIGVGANLTAVADGYQVAVVDNFAISPPNAVLASGEVITVRIKLRALAGQSGTIKIGNYNGNASPSLVYPNLTDQWQTYEYQQTMTSGIGFAPALRSGGTLAACVFKDIQVTRDAARGYVETTGTKISGRQPAAAVISTGDIRLGLFSDFHYSADGNGGSGHDTNLSTLISQWNALSVSAVLGLGDMWHGDDWPGNAEMIVDVDHVESLLESLNTSAIAFVTGNHEDPRTFALWENSQYARENFTLDVGANYRIIGFFNSDEPYFSARAATLTWLESALAQAKIDSKKIIVCTHARIDQNYPGTPINFTTPPASPGVVTPSATTGTGVVVTADTPVFALADVGRYLFIKQGTAWGQSIITGFTDTTHVTVDVIQDFASTAASTSWGFEGYSGFCYNADDCRTVINAAIDAGCPVLAVLQGHTHAYAYMSNVDSRANYWTIPASNTAAAGYMMVIAGDDVHMYGNASAVANTSGLDVLGNSLQYPGPLGIDATVTAGTVYPAITIQAPLGAEFQKLDAFTGEAEVDLETFVPDEFVRTGPNGTLVYSAARDAAGILRADKVVGA